MNHVLLLQLTRVVGFVTEGFGNFFLKTFSVQYANSTGSVVDVMDNVGNPKVNDSDNFNLVTQKKYSLTVMKSHILNVSLD